MPSRSSSLPALLAALGLALALPGRPQPDAAAPEALAPDAPTARPLAAGESHAFAAELAAGRTYLLAVEERGIDVAVEVRAPGGALLAAAASPLERWGAEQVLLRPAAAGRHRIDVRSTARGVGPGRYEVRLAELPASSPAFRERIAALAAATRGGALLVKPATGSAEKALAAFREALAQFHAAGDPAGEAEATAAVAALARRAGSRREAADLYREAARRWRELGRPDREVRAWADLGLTLWELGDLPAADDALGRGLALARETHDAYGEADLGNDRCLVVHARGEVRAALDCYREAVERFRRLGEARDEASVLNSIGYAEFSLGEPGPAEESYRRALAIRRATGDRAGEAQALNNLAVLFRGLGEPGAALADYAAEREILAGLDDRRQEASAWNNLGVLYEALGEPERARRDYARALELRRAVEDRRGEVATLANLGWLAERSGDLAGAAASYRRSLALAEATADRRGQAMALSHLGAADAGRGRFDEGRFKEGIAELDRALALAREVGDRRLEAGTLLRQGEALAARGRPALALPPLSGALALARELGDRASEAAAATARARVERDLGDLPAAQKDAAAAVAAVEALRSRVGDPDLRSSFLGSREEAYEVAIDVLMRLAAAHPGQGFERAALETSERARARTLLDFLRASGAEVQGADAALAARRRDLERRLALKEDRLQALLSSRGQTADRKALEGEVESVRAELDGVDAEIRQRDPRLAALTQPGGATSAEVQALLDPGTLLLEYALGRERSYLWAVGAATLHAYALPGREAIERAARALHRELAAPPGAGGPGRGRLGGELARLVLAPAAAELGDRRLAVVADGALLYIPFDVLPEPAGTGGEAEAPLLARHEVVALPSASALAAERRDLAHRPPAPRLALVLGDPVFDAGDSRVARGAERRVGATAAKPAAVALRGAEPDASPRYGRLRFSRQEALAIAALAPQGEVDTAIGFAAGRDLALSGKLRDYRYLHFATHGELDDAHPELSALVLSRVDDAGRPRDGYLRPRDVYGLDLDAELVVLSGCRTALGREVRGEGLLGLTRGFLYAGAARVVASLWPVDDRATAELMTRFYRGLWAEGKRPADALRRARLALAAERRFRDPFYWGPFVLQGDWR